MICSFIVFFFNDTATTEIYTLSLHDALPISRSRADEGVEACCESFRGRPNSSESARRWEPAPIHPQAEKRAGRREWRRRADRKSTRLNSSHGYISYAVFCLKKKKNNVRGKAI